jgi:hypothetical protein
LCVFQLQDKINFLDFCSFGRSSLPTAGFILVALSVDILTGYLFGFTFGFLMFKAYKITKKYFPWKLWVYYDTSGAISALQSTQKKAWDFFISIRARLVFNSGLVCNYNTRLTVKPSRIAQNSFYSRIIS